MRRRIRSVQILVDCAPTLFFNENLSRRRRVELGFVRWESIFSSESVLGDTWTPSL